MRALHLVSSPDRRGAQVFATMLAAELGGGPDHLVVAVGPARGGRPLEVDALGRGRSDPRGLVRLVRLLRDRQVLVAHGSSALLHGAAAGALARRPFVYRNIGDPSSWGSVRAADLRIGAPLRRAAAVSAIYPGARDHLVAAYRLDPARVRTIPNGVAPARPAGADGRTAARAALGLGDGTVWVGFVGALSPEKGILDAVAAVVGDERLGLVVAGDGPQAAEARAAAGPAGDRVRFLGAVQDPGAVYDAVDVVVLPSRTEGIPAAAVEAGLRAVPVVATPVGGVGQVVLDGRTGLLVDEPAPDALSAALARAASERRGLGAAAQAHCEERFTIGRVARLWDRLLADVLAGRVP